MKTIKVILFSFLLNFIFIQTTVAQPENDSIKRRQLLLDEVVDLNDAQNSNAQVDPYTEPVIIYQSENIQVQPQFPGGKNTMNTFIAKNFILSKEMIDNEMERILFVSFIVDENGRLSDSKVLRDDILVTAKEEAINLVKKMPNWIPGEHNGKKVKCYFTIPIYINAKK